MVAKIKTKVLLISLLLALASKAEAQETTTVSAKPENKIDFEKKNEKEKVNEKENVILEPSKIDGYFTPSFGPPNRFPKPEVSYYALKPKHHEPLYYFPSTYHVKPRPYHQPHVLPQYRHHEGRHRGIDQGYRNHHQHHQGHIPRYRKPWGSFPHYEVSHKQFAHRPLHYPQHFGGYSHDFYEGSTPRIYPSALNFHTFDNYELIKIHHSDNYEARQGEKNSATGSPEITTAKPNQEIKDTILIPETKDTKLEVDVTIATPTTEETKTVSEEGKTATR